MSTPLYVFVDNSNLWIEGKKVSGRKGTPPVPSNYNYRVEYGKLLKHIVGTRKLADVPKLYGSEPPPNDSVWKMIKSKGFDVQVFKRNIFNKEKGVDMKMGIDVTKLTLQVSPPQTIALVCGDADFVPVVEQAHEQGWKVEVWYWHKAAGTLKSAADRYEDLNADVDTFGYESR
jgi:uncharacterized LabA/DUF88 family protein